MPVSPSGIDYQPIQQFVTSRSVFGWLRTELIFFGIGLGLIVSGTAGLFAYPNTELGRVSPMVLVLGGLMAILSLGGLLVSLKLGKPFVTISERGLLNETLTETLFWFEISEIGESAEGLDILGLTGEKVFIRRTDFDRMDEIVDAVRGLAGERGVPYHVVGSKGLPRETQ